MKKLLIIGLILIPIVAMAQMFPTPMLGMSCPGRAPLCQNTNPTGVWVFDFTQQVLPANFTFTRASAANYFNSSGLLVSAATNVPRFDYGFPGSSTYQGLLLESGVTNYLLYSRDLTQTADWTATNMTIALNQTGLDGASNSASSITATANNATVCQSLTLSSAARLLSLYAKRISGTGAISISQDSGATYQTITPTSSWANYNHQYQSTLNPTICIKLATSGDEIAVDAVQFENVLTAGTTGPTSPILTTTIAGTRASDSLTANTPWYNTLGGSFVYQWQNPSTINGAGNYVTLGNYIIGLNGSNMCIPTSSCPGVHPGPYLNMQNFGGIIYSSPNGVSVSVLNGVIYSGNVASLQSAPTTMTLGNIREWVQKFTYWNYPLTTAQLVAATR